MEKNVFKNSVSDFDIFWISNKTCWYTYSLNFANPALQDLDFSMRRQTSNVDYAIIFKQRASAVEKRWFSYILFAINVHMHKKMCVIT